MTTPSAQSATPSQPGGEPRSGVRVRVSIVEDDRITREGLAALVRKSPNLELVETYPDGESAIRGIAHTPPDVVVMDLNLTTPGSGQLNGTDCVAALKAAHARLQVIMLTVYDDADRIFESLRAGASGYILKRTPPEEIVAAIQEVHAGGAPMSMQIARRVVDSFRRAAPMPEEFQSLTPREREILSLLAEGGLYKEIAKKLGISTSTVRVHLHSIYSKLHVQTRTQAVLKYLGK